MLSLKSLMLSIPLCLLVMSCAPTNSGHYNQRSGQSARNPTNNAGFERQNQSVGAGADSSRATRPAAQTSPVIPIEIECIEAEQMVCDIEKLITQYTNEIVRRPAGRKDIKHDAKLAWVSRDWSKTMGSGAGLSHRGFPSQRKQVYQSKFQSSRSMFAENVAYGIRGNTAEKVAMGFVNMWKNSSGHRRNMLGNHGSLGSGVYNAGGTWWATQIFGR